MTHITDLTQKLIYKLFKEDGTTPIDFGSTFINNIGDGFGGAVQSITIKGVLETNQQVITGAYRDTLIVTLGY